MRTRLGRQLARRPLAEASCQRRLNSTPGGMAGSSQRRNTGGLSEASSAANSSAGTGRLPRTCLGRLLSSFSTASRCGAMDAQVGALGKVVAQQPVGVLVRAALPGRVGVAEVDRRAGGRGDRAMAGHLGALVPGDRPQQRCRQAGHPRLQRVVQGRRCAIGHVQERTILVLPLHQGADRRPAQSLPTMRSPSVRLSVAREGRVWLRSPCVRTLTGNVRPALPGVP